MHCLSTIIHLNSPEETAKRQPRKLSSTAPEVKLSIVHIPTRGEKIAEGLKKHHANKRRQVHQVNLTQDVARKLASKWGAKYQIEEGI